MVTSHNLMSLMPSLKETSLDLDPLRGLRSSSVTADEPQILIEALSVVVQQQQVTGVGLRTGERSMFLELASALSDLDHIGWIPAAESFPLTFEITSWDEGQFIPYLDDEME